MSGRKRILITSTFPIAEPRHGGQKRVSALVESYRRRFDRAEYVAVYNPQEYRKASARDIPFTADLVRRASERPLTGDLIAGHAIAEDPEVRRRFTAVLSEIRPEVIHVEHPFSYIGLKPLLDDLKLRPQIVFGSANIEAPLRRTVLEQFGFQPDVTAEVVAEIADAEARFSRECDLLAACTTDDLAVHVSMGARASVLAPNGMSPLAPTPAAMSAWRARVERSGGRRYAAFVGSGHLPNVAGFESLIGHGLGFLGPEDRLVLAGSIGPAVERMVGEPETSIEAATFWLRAINAGQLREGSLQGLIGAADALVLPIGSGGGSNLKTAEAILANTRVVCTTTALRGFEWFADFPNVIVADSLEEFHAGVARAFEQPLEPRTAEQSAKAQTVTWANCLRPLMDAVEAI